MFGLAQGFSDSLRNFKIDGLGTNLNNVMGSTSYAGGADNGGGFLGGLWQGVKDVAGWLGKGADSKSGITNFDRALNGVGMAGNLWGAYNQQKMAKKNFDLQKDAYELNKAEHLRQVASRDKRNKQLEQVWG